MARTSAGIQDVGLDRALIKARAPGTLEARKAAFSKLQTRLADKNYLLPIAFRDELVVLSRPGPGTGHPRARRPQ